MMLTNDAKLHPGVDESEEGEVADNSEPEDVDSDHNDFAEDHSPYPRTTHKSVGTGSNLQPRMPLSNVQNYANDSLPSTHPIPNGEDNVDVIGLHDVDYRIPANLFRYQSFSKQVSAELNQPPVQPNLPHFTNFERFRNSLPQQPIFPYGMQPTSHKDDDLRRPVEAPPALPLDASGSREEIEKMHELYHKACELYEKAKAKVGSSGFSLPPDLVPKPPPIPLPPKAPVLPTFPLPPPPTRIMKPPPTVARTVLDNTGAQSLNTSAANILPPASKINTSIILEPSVPVNPILTSVTVAVPQLPPPVTTQAHSHYGMAYSLAYKQTVQAMPNPASGGPAHDTPEYAAMWQHYMDYYLRYYLHAFSNMNSSAIPTTTPVVSLPVPILPNPGDPVLPSIATEDIPRPMGSPKDRKSPVKIATTPKLSENKPSEFTSNKTIETPPASETSVEPKSTASDSSVKQTNIPVIDDLSESKCVWISNLPQGVKAVDVKERCSPYGRVQTIKIIGSRKTTPPAIYAYLVMETAAIAKSLVDGLQNAKFDGQEIKIKRINALPIP